MILVTSVVAQISPAVARDIIAVLDRGVAPSDGLIGFLHATCDQQVLHRVKEFVEDEAPGKPPAMFVLGEPGAGKTYSLTILRDALLRQGFVTSLLTLDIATRCLPNRPDLLTQHILARMTLPDDLAVAGDPLSRLIDAWATLALEISADPIRDMAFLGNISDRGLLPPNFSSLDPRTRLALLLYLVGRRQADTELMRLSVEAVRDRMVENRMLMKAATDNGLIFRQFRVTFTPGPYDLNHFLGKLRILTWLSQCVGWRGIVVLVDEISAISDLRHTPSRRKAFQNLNAVCGLDDVRGLSFVLASIPAFAQTLHREGRAHVDGAKDLEEFLRNNSIEIGRIGRTTRRAVALQIEAIAAIALGRERDVARMERLAADLDDARTGWTMREWVRQCISVARSNA